MKKILAGIGKYIYLPIIGGISVLVVQQLFFKGNELEKAKLSVKKELLIKQHSHLEKMERMIEIGEMPIFLVYKHLYLNSNGETTGIDEIGLNVDIPRLAYEKTLQEEWNKLTFEISENKELISFDLYRPFEEVVNFVNNNPFPENSTYEGIMKSNWADGNIQARWKSLNMQLRLKIINKKNLLD